MEWNSGKIGGVGINLFNWLSWYEIAINREGLNDWELDLMVNFLHVLESNIPPTGNGDRVRWKLKKNGDLDICSFYNELQGSLSIVFSWKGIWKVKAP